MLETLLFSKLQTQIIYVSSNSGMHELHRQSIMTSPSWHNELQFRKERIYGSDTHSLSSGT